MATEIKTTPRPPRLLDRVREANRLRHGSRSTEKSYVGWIRRFVLFHGKRHPAEMGAPEVAQFLSSLAVEGHVAASTQNQALSALLFLYRHVLHQDLPWLDDVVRARRPRHLPVVLTREEVRTVISAPQGTPRLMATLLYGSGLRLLECARLRVQDVDFAMNQIIVRDGKGSKDRVTVLPAVAKQPLTEHLRQVKRQHGSDVTMGAGWVELPWALARKYPNAGREWHGSGCSPPLGSTSIALRANAGAIIYTRQYCSARCSRQFAARVWTSGRRRIRSGTRSPRICSKTVATPHRSGAPGPQRRQHHDDLHPCPKPRTVGRDKPRRPRPGSLITRAVGAVSELSRSVYLARGWSCDRRKMASVEGYCVGGFGAGGELCS